MQARRQPSRMTRDNQPEAVVLVWIGLGVFVQIDEKAMIQQRSFAFGNRFQPGQQIGEFLYVPAADVSEHALAVRAVGARSFAVRVSVIVMARRRVAQPREPGQALALSKHVRGDARLPTREGLY